MISSLASPSSQWARPAVDCEAFRQEQSALAHVWTFLGFTTDLEGEGDWFSASLASRAVFVQRIGSEIRGFENTCAHRHYPLREGERGSGPIVCPYHHWRYDGEGRVVAVPRCKEIFGLHATDLDIRLKSIDIATCGTLVFGRFRGGAESSSLEDYLGLAFHVLAAMSPKERSSKYMTECVQANWRFCFHITLDDYHAVTVHPTTLGKQGYLSRDKITYTRFGLHSAFISDANHDSFEKMALACRDGIFQSSTYSIFHIFPNFLLANLLADEGHWRCCIQQYVPMSPSQSNFRGWTYSAPFGARRPWFRRCSDSMTDPIRARVFQYYAKRVVREDLRICESLQRVAGQIVTAPLLGQLEERIAWFEEAYHSICSSHATYRATDKTHVPQ
jgi:phenylpropionate dioxygenase-like ring-hydroxylating dioxygenase large terminal subunit